MEKERILHPKNCDRSKNEAFWLAERKGFRTRTYPIKQTKLRGVLIGIWKGGMSCPNFSGCLGLILWGLSLFRWGTPEWHISIYIYIWCWPISRIGCFRDTSHTCSSLGQHPEVFWLGALSRPVILIGGQSLDDVWCWPISRSGCCRAINSCSFLEREHCVSGRRYHVDSKAEYRLFDG